MIGGEFFCARASSNHIILWLYQAHITSAMIKINPGKREGDQE